MSQDKTKSKMLLGSQHTGRASMLASQPSLPTLYSGVPSDLSELSAARLSLDQPQASGKQLLL